MSPTKFQRLTGPAFLFMLSGHSHGWEEITSRQTVGRSQALPSGNALLPFNVIGSEPDVLLSVLNLNLKSARLREEKAKTLHL